MRIGVNARFLLDGKLEGLGRYSHEILSRIVLFNPQHQFVFFFDRPYAQKFVYAENVEPVVISPPARHPFLWYLWFEWAIPRALKKHKIDYFISVDSFLSLRSSVSQHLVIHDLAFEHFPEGTSKLVYWYYKKFTPRYCNKAIRIISVSAFTKTDIHLQYGTKLAKIDSILNGVSTSFNVQTTTNTANQASYFVFVGAMHPRKNIARLLHAFDQYKKQSNLPHKLKLVGRKGWQNEEMEQVFEQMSFKNDVEFVGKLSDVELVSVLNNALAMLYVPFFEGFGLPIIEAQACGLPVIASNTSSMPEVLGQGGILVDPFDVDSICEAMVRISDVELQKELSKKGLENVKRFDWNQSAKDFWISVEKGMKDAGL